MGRMLGGNALLRRRREQRMDELSRIWFQTMCRQCPRDARGIAFQDLFAGLMELAFPRDFQRIRPYAVSDQQTTPPGG